MCLLCTVIWGVIRQDSVVGQVEPVKVVSTVFRYEHPKKRDNFSVARRVLLRKRSTLPNEVSRVTEGLDSSFAQRIQEPLTQLPEQLTELYNSSAEGTTVGKKRVIHWLLLKHQLIFCQNENDLGRTSLVEHTFDTDDAKPIMQPPHHLLMVFVDKDCKVLANFQA